MTSYFLFTPNFSHAHNACYDDCMKLGLQLVRQGKYELLKVARVRGGEREAVVIFDITTELVMQTRGVRIVSSRTLQKLSEDSPLEK